MLLRSFALALAALMLCALPASAASTTVAVRDDFFRARLVTVSKGARVIWVNRGHERHTVTTRRWHVVLRPGERYSRIIRRDWRYVCAYHGSMTGRVACRNC
jgi:plastocyanin